MSILSIQSSVAYGHVGNAAAVFALQRLGHEVWPIDTVRYSNHPGYGRFRGRKTSAPALRELIEGLDDIGILDRTRAVLSGYLGTPAVGRVLNSALDRVNVVAPAALYCCDPVMGDRAEGFYLPAELLAFFRDIAVPRAQIVTPNHFELERLVDRRLPTLAHVRAAARDLQARGPETVVVTSVLGEGIDGDEIGTLAVDAADCWLVTTPLLPHAAKGAGDLFAALLLAHRLDGKALIESLARAVSSVFSVIHATLAAGGRELRLIAVQDALIRPEVRFVARRLR